MAGSGAERPAAFSCDAAARNVLNAAIAGNCDRRAEPALSAFLAGIHRAAEQGDIREIALDLRELEFLNTACLRALVGWVDELRSLAATRPLLIRLRANPARTWQRRSLHALKCFAADLITVDG